MWNEHRELGHRDIDGYGMYCERVGLKYLRILFTAMRARKKVRIQVRFIKTWSRKVRENGTKRTGGNRCKRWLGERNKIKNFHKPSPP